MGYEVPERTATLTFIGTDYEGAEITVRINPSMRDYLAIETVSEDPDGSKILVLFGDQMITGWNLERQGEPIEVSGESFASQPVALCQLVFGNWKQAVALPPDPLSQPSVNGPGETPEFLSAFSTPS